MRNYLLTLSITLMVSGVFLMTNSSFDNSNEIILNNTEQIKDNVPLSVSLLDITNNRNEEILEEKQVFSTFDDVKNSWAKEYIVKMLDQGILKGETSNKFDTKKKVTRGMLITALGKIEGVNEYGKSSFIDIDESNENYKYYAWAEYKGLLLNNLKKFDENEIITREEIAYIVSNYLLNVKEFVMTHGNNYNDEKSFSSYAIDSIYYLKGMDVMTGEENNNFEPKGDMTKDEFAVLLSRIWDLINY